MNTKFISPRNNALSSSKNEIRGRLPVYSKTQTAYPDLLAAPAELFRGGDRRRQKRTTNWRGDRTGDMDEAGGQASDGTFTTTPWGSHNNI